MYTYMHIYNYYLKCVHIYIHIRIHIYIHFFSVYTYTTYYVDLYTHINGSTYMFLKMHFVHNMAMAIYFFINQLG